MMSSTPRGKYFKRSLSQALTKVIEHNISNNTEKDGKCSLTGDGYESSLFTAVCSNTERTSLNTSPSTEIDLSFVRKSFETISDQIRSQTRKEFKGVVVDEKVDMLNEEKTKIFILKELSSQFSRFYHNIDVYGLLVLTADDGKGKTILIPFNERLHEAGSVSHISHSKPHANVNDNFGLTSTRHWRMDNGDLTQMKHSNPDSSSVPPSNSRKRKMRPPSKFTPHRNPPDSSPKGDAFCSVAVRNDNIPATTSVIIPPKNGIEMVPKKLIRSEALPASTVTDMKEEKAVDTIFANKVLEEDHTLCSSQNDNNTLPVGNTVDDVPYSVMNSVNPPLPVLKSSVDNNINSRILVSVDSLFENSPPTNSLPILSPMKSTAVNCNSSSSNKSKSHLISEMRMRMSSGIKMNHKNSQRRTNRTIRAILGESRRRSRRTSSKPPISLTALVSLRDDVKFSEDCRQKSSHAPVVLTSPVGENDDNSVAAKQRGTIISERQQSQKSVEEQGQLSNFPAANEFNSARTEEDEELAQLLGFELIHKTNAYDTKKVASQNAYSTFKCKRCEEILQGDLVAHAKMCGSYKCEYCGKLMSRLNELQTHQRVAHSDDEPHDSSEIAQPPQLQIHHEDRRVCQSSRRVKITHPHYLRKHPEKCQRNPNEEENREILHSAPDLNLSKGRSDHNLSGPKMITINNGWNNLMNTSSTVSQKALEVYSDILNNVEKQMLSRKV